MSHRARELAEAWSLDLDQEAGLYGEWSQVLMVHRGQTPYVLKIVGDDHSATHEAAALRAWGGNGAALLIEEAPDALLLERLNPDQSLSNLNLVDALPIYASLLRELNVPAPPGIPDLTAHLAAMSNLSLPPELLPTHHVDLVRRLAAALANDTPGNALIHGDLHTGNILEGDRRPWLAIDPKPCAGHIERTLAELFWTRSDEMEDIPDTLTRLAASADLDSERARAWVIVRTASYLTWATTAGLTDDPVRCRRVIRSLA